MESPQPAVQPLIDESTLRVELFDDDYFVALHLDFDQAVEGSISIRSNLIHPISLLKDNPTILNNRAVGINGL